MKNSIIVLSALALLLTVSCEKKSKLTLDIDDAVFAVMSDDGKLSPIDSVPTYYPGDSVIMVLVNVGEFDKDKEGYSSVSMNVEIKDEDGNIITQKEALSAGQGRVALETQYLGSPYAVWQSTYEVMPGKYTYSVIVNDELTGNTTRISKSFFMQ